MSFIINKFFKKIDTVTLNELSQNTLDQGSSVVTKNNSVSVSTNTDNTNSNWMITDVYNSVISFVYDIFSLNVIRNKINPKHKDQKQIIRRHSLQSFISYDTLLKIPRSRREAMYKRHVNRRAKTNYNLTDEFINFSKNLGNNTVFRHYRKNDSALF